MTPFLFRSNGLKMNKERLLSLDVFRGLTIIGMILVNNPGSWKDVYSPLLHAEWNGCTPTDLVFPFFLFIVGVSIVFSLNNILSANNKEVSSQTLKRIFKRFFILFLLGIFLAAFPKFEFNTMRIPGVLQRIAFVYLFASLILLSPLKNKLLHISVLILIVYWLLIYFIPIPNYGYTYMDKENNIIAWIDRYILSNHLYRQGINGDPEGILSTLPALVTTISGMILGKYLIGEKDKILKVVWIFFGGTILMIIGYLWDFWFPINKNLWTSSYVVYTSGMALIGFGICYWLIDVLGYKKLIQPFLVFGKNAITAFFLSSLTAKILFTVKFNSEEGKLITLKGFLYNMFFIPYFAPKNASLFFALFTIMFWYIILLILYKKNIFIKI